MTYAQRLARAYKRELAEHAKRNQQNNVEYGINRKISANKDRNVPDYRTPAYETMHERLQKYAVRLYGLDKRR